MTEPHVRPARLADLNSFAAALGDREFLTDRYERQRKGRGVLFLAWLDYRPAGDVYLWLEKAEEALIRWHLPGVPLIMHLEVHRELRNQGIGQALVGAVECHLAEQGHDRVALAVRTDNPDAARLYARLGYRDWGHGEVTCYALRPLAGGGVLEEPERCHVLTKDLAIPAPPAQRTGSSAVGASRPG